ncbi:MAG: beta-N-acetylhexosaminidase [Clostridiales bacterium]|jgi:hexosaminidase|nr:beta-N-acetylhexosaminidase [Clostridiales bacterium]
MDCNINIIPKPKKLHITGEGELNLGELRGIAIDANFDGVLPIIAQTFLDKLGIEYSATASGDVPTLNVKYKEDLPGEGYAITVGKNGIDVFAGDKNGALYAFQTLRIATLADSASPRYTLPYMKISDYPDEAWRGMHLDVARHFYKVGEVKKLIDLMLLHKLNVMHFHLTDDQGWRIEIKKYPLLTEIGSKRKKTHIHGWLKDDDDGTPHEGYYTKDDIKDIIAYAAARGIDVFPEIDMPAHFAAAFAAYPHLACRNKAVEVPWYFGGHYPLKHGVLDWNRSACMGKKATFDFICDVIDEVTELFPSKYFHIGGDEVPRGEWEKCPDCRRVMDEQGFKNTRELHGLFLKKVNEYVKTKGKTLIAWNEILSGRGDIDTDIIVQYWTPKRDRNVVEYLKRGGRVLISKHRPLYLDMPHSKYTLSDAYALTRFFEDITPEYASQIVGSEATMWTEWIATIDKIEFQLFPRLTAVAEAVWRTDDRDFAEFLPRLTEFNEKILTGLGVNYAKYPIANPKNAIKKFITALKWHVKDPDIEYNANKDLK